MASFFGLSIKSAVYAGAEYISRIDVIDFHTLPIKYRRHASDRLKERFRMAIDEVRHCLKTGKTSKSSEKTEILGL